MEVLGLYGRRLQSSSVAPATLQTGGQTENADKQSVQLLNHSVTQSLSESTSAPTDISDSSCATLYHGRTANPRDSRSLESACWLIGGGGTRKGRLHLSHPAWVPQGLSVPDDPAKAHSAHEGLAWHLLVENQDEGELEDGRRKRRMM
ncbi:hypothetical protein AN4503.2 [Aspergillus nidulans FGSC A4]|uniref:Uncharacterized protein n=1 Tax=Emericella nidulans (strain FGSC A4 / ATCC 38163 / CBS 112.46 / NRRL 194 / M139) TaxID=227321 RepID=Q5B4M7_EMENI|nr:hypothetical protein [Aspergillus nidulans FGSC A4]EAA60846.1 hypothetical protein AN4503.2 [Aspergillus nidulans FGSC A4]CBF77376.1 TPA: conserved hypothetical protein [Aspergillus nidulans FGSC A4]|eukprot:XP_662107.1 hypothetical protein AN4503.2 [Aspergillus nidulans FGSC A4]